MFSLCDAIYASKVLNVTFDKFTKADILNGMNVELEHGIINPKTNVTNNDIILTVKKLWLI